MKEEKSRRTTYVIIAKLADGHMKKTQDRAIKAMCPVDVFWRYRYFIKKIWFE